jgi:DNA-binding LacI/PurR family transcriptional regulator
MKIKSASSLEVAKLAGVSQATVSYVLNKRGDQAISESTRQRVLDAARELKYRPNRLANGVLRGKTSIIGLIAPWLESSFHVSILNGIREVIDREGYHAFVTWGKHEADEQAREVEILLEHRVDGIVYISEGNQLEAHAESWLREVIAEGIPCVVVDDRSLSDIVDCVVSDDVTGARSVVDHLVSLGHRRIAFWGSPWSATPYRDRVDGYRQGLEAAGIAFDPALVMTLPEHPRKTAIALHRILSAPNPPTAIFCPGDIPAMLAKHAADDIGLNVPGNFALAGYSDQDYSRNNDITSVKQNAREMGAAAARLLLKRMQASKTPLSTTFVATELVVRPSTVPMPRSNRFDPVE